MIKWIYFDVGSTMVDETEAYDHRVRDMIAGRGITFQEFDQVRITVYSLTAYDRVSLLDKDLTEIPKQSNISNWTRHPGIRKMRFLFRTYRVRWQPSAARVTSLVS